MTAGRLLLAVLVTVGLVVGVGARPAAACSCGHRDDASILAESPLVFYGRMVRTSTSARIANGGRVLTYAVDRVFKGEVENLVEVATPGNGGTCGLEPTAPGVTVLVVADPKSAIEHFDATSPPSRVRYSSIVCSGGREVSAGPLPAPFGEGRPPTGSLTLEDLPASAYGRWARWRAALGLPVVGLVVATVGAVSLTRRRRRRS